MLQGFFEILVLFRFFKNPFKPDDLEPSKKTIGTVSAWNELISGELLVSGDEVTVSPR